MKTTFFNLSLKIRSFTALFVTLFAAIASIFTKTAFAAIENPVIGELGNDAGDAASGALFTTLVGNVLEALVFVAGLLLLIYLIWGSIEWITSGGDKGKLEGAQKRMTQAIIGMVVLASSFAIFMIIQSLLGFEIFDFGNGVSSSSSGGGGGGINTRPPNEQE